MGAQVLVFKEHPLDPNACAAEVLIPSLLYVFSVYAIVPTFFCSVFTYECSSNFAYQPPKTIAPSLSSNQQMGSMVLE